MKSALNVSVRHIFILTPREYHMAHAVMTKDDKGFFLLMDTGAGRLCCWGGHSAAAASMAALPLADSERGKVQTTHKHSNDCVRT